MSDWASSQYGSEMHYTAQELNQISQNIAAKLQTTGGKKKKAAVKPKAAPKPAPKPKAAKKPKATKKPAVKPKAK